MGKIKIKYIEFWMINYLKFLIEMILLKVKMLKIIFCKIKDLKVMLNMPIFNYYYIYQKLLIFILY